MKCPNCGGATMRGGFLAVRRSGTNILALGLGSSSLVFEENKAEDVPLLDSGRSMPGFRCRACGTVVGVPKA